MRVIWLVESDHMTKILVSDWLLEMGVAMHDGSMCRRHYPWGVLPWQRKGLRNRKWGQRSIWHACASCRKSKPEVTESEVTVTWFVVGNRWPVGKKDRGLRQDGGRGLHGFWSSCELQSKMADHMAGSDQTKKHPCLKRKYLLIKFFLITREGTWTRVVNDTCPRERVQSLNWIWWSGRMLPWREALVEDKCRTTNYASPAAARSPKFKCYGKGHAPWERVQGRLRDMSKEARPKLLLHLGHARYEWKWVMSKEVCQMSYGRRAMEIQPYPYGVLLWKGRGATWGGLVSMNLNSKVSPEC